MVRKLIYDLDALTLAFIGLSLNNVHEIASILVLTLTGIYTCFKIKRDFFTKKDN